MDLSSHVDDEFTKGARSIHVTSTPTSQKIVLSFLKNWVFTHELFAVINIINCLPFGASAMVTSCLDIFYTCLHLSFFLPLPFLPSGMMKRCVRYYFVSYSKSDHVNIEIFKQDLQVLSKWQIIFFFNLNIDNFTKFNCNNKSIIYTIFIYYEFLKCYLLSYENNNKEKFL